MARTKAELKQLRIQGEKLWLEHKPVNAIATALGVNTKTIYTWNKKYGWTKKEDQMINKIRDDLQIDIAEEKMRSLRIIKVAEDHYAKRLIMLPITAGLPKDTTMFTQLQKIKWDILMPKTTNQYNFMQKKELNINVNLPELLRAIRNGQGI